MNIQFCFSSQYNDHHAYPKSLVNSPPPGWTYRETEVKLNPEIGRPWTKFATLPKEWIHASSLLPSGKNLWVFDTDHSEYLLEQIKGTYSPERPVLDRSLAERLILRSLSSPCRMGLIAWSESAKQSIQDMYLRHGKSDVEICVAYPSVIPPTEQPSSEELLMLDALRMNVNSASMVLLAIDVQPGICEIEGRKNLDGAVHCHKILNQHQHVEAHLILVSKNNSNYSYSNKVHWLPRLSRSALWRVYGFSDILLFLTHADATGFVLLEAMYHGLCCIGADAPSSPYVSEVIEEGITGFKVKFKQPAPYPQFSRTLDFSAVTQVLVRLDRNPDIRKKIGSTAKNQFTSGHRFSVDVRNSRIQEHIYQNYERFLANEFDKKLHIQN